MQPQANKEHVETPSSVDGDQADLLVGPEDADDDLKDDDSEDDDEFEDDDSEEEDGEDDDDTTEDEAETV